MSPVEASPTARGLRSQTVTTMRVRFGGCLEGGQVSIEKQQVLFQQSPRSLPSELMKIASFNINNINRRLTNLLNWLREAEPAIVCLQELKCGDAEFPAEAIRQAGYHAVRSWRIHERPAEPWPGGKRR